MKTLKIFTLMSLSIASFGCGTGIDPLVLFDDSIPELGPIISSSFVGSWVTVPFSASNPFWVMSQASFGVGNFLAPQRGVVTELGTDSISIIHSGRIATKIVGLTSINIRVGDTVTAGQALALFIGSGNAEFHVYLDGNAVCPLSFLSQTFRQGFGSFSSPCQ